MIRPQGPLILFIFLITISLAYIPMIEGDPLAPQHVMDCEDCHESFVPFEVTAIPPRNYRPGKVGQFTVKVSNSQDHDLEDMVARLMAPSFNNSLPLNDAISSSVSFRSTTSHDIEVAEGAIYIRVSMQEHPLPPGLADASLSLTSPAGDTVSSNTGGATELVEMESTLLKKAGAGTFTISVRHVNGFRPMPYDLSIFVDYTNMNYSAPIGDLPTGSEAEVTWDLTLSKEDSEQLKVVVTGTAEHMHSDGGYQSSNYTVEASFDTKPATGRDPGAFEFPREIRWPVRYAIAIMFCIVVAIGMPQIRRPLIKKFNPKIIRWAHNYIAISMVPLFTFHAYMELMRFPLQSYQVITGIALASLVSGLNFMGYFRTPICRFCDTRIWKWAHRLLTIMTVAVLVVHIYL